MKLKILKLFFYLLFLIHIPFVLYAQSLPVTLKQAPQEQEQAPKEKEETSRLINLDVKDADIKDIMRMFSKVSELNIIMGDDVRGTVTLSVSDVDWEDALNMILRTNNLTSVREGKFLRIMTYDKFRQEQDGVPLINETVFLNFVTAEEIAAMLQPLQSGRGRVMAHSTTNSLVITETPDNFKKMLEVIEKLDKRTPQVMIELLMLDVKLTSDDRFGINWTVTHKQVSERSFTQTLRVGSAATGVIRYGNTVIPAASLSAVIDFLCQQGKAEVLANPKIMTQDGKAANIDLTEEIPYLESTITPTTGGATQTYSFKSAGIKLSVAPHINNEGFISMNLKTEQSYQTATTSTGQPIIDSRKAETNLSVKDGETIVIGGLRKKDTTITVDRIPILGKIPLLGVLFRKTLRTAKDTELLIFVTPHIITEPELSSEEKAGFERFKKLRKEKKKVDFLDEEKPFSLRPPE